MTATIPVVQQIGPRCWQIDFHGIRLFAPDPLEVLQKMRHTLRSLAADEAADRIKQAHRANVERIGETN